MAYKYCGIYKSLYIFILQMSFYDDSVDSSYYIFIAQVNLDLPSHFQFCSLVKAMMMMMMIPCKQMRKLSIRDFKSFVTAK